MLGHATNVKDFLHVFRPPGYLVLALETQISESVALFDKRRWWRGIWRSEKLVDFLEVRRNKLESIARFATQTLIAFKNRLPRAYMQLPVMRADGKRAKPYRTDMSDIEKILHELYAVSQLDGVPSNIISESEWRQTALYREISNIYKVFQPWLGSMQQLLCEKKASPTLHEVGVHIESLVDVIEQTYRRDRGIFHRIYQFLRAFFVGRGPSVENLRERLANIPRNDGVECCRNIIKEMRNWEKDLVSDVYIVDSRLESIQLILESYHQLFRVMRYRFEGRPIAWPMQEEEIQTYPLWQHQLQARDASAKARRVTDAPQYETVQPPCLFTP